MKKWFFYTVITLTVPIVGKAQPKIDLAPNQNPRYQESRDHYMKIKDSLTSWHHTTFQQTYKAYDWREARNERRALRRQRRHEERLQLAKYGNSWRYHPYYYHPYSSSHHYYPYYPYSSTYPYYDRAYTPWVGFGLGLGIGGVLRCK